MVGDKSVLSPNWTTLASWPQDRDGSPWDPYSVSWLQHKLDSDNYDLCNKFIIALNLGFFFFTGFDRSYQTPGEDM